jgi:hypothetical protein
MDITKAIIAGIATILSAIIALLLKEYFDKKKEPYKKIDEQIKDAVHGRWKGSFQQVLNDTHQTFDLELDIRVSNTGSLTGKAKYPYKNEIIDINIKGGFYSERFLKMDYENSNKAIMQFGSFVFKLSDDAKILTGYFVGYGHISGKVIGGNAVLNKT